MSKALVIIEEELASAQQEAQLLSDGNVEREKAIAADTQRIDELEQDIAQLEFAKSVLTDPNPGIVARIFRKR